MKPNKPEVIQKYYRKLYLKKIVSFEADYDII